MTQQTAQAIPNTQVPACVGNVITPIYLEIFPSLFSADVAAADTLKVATLPKDAVPVNWSITTNTVNLQTTSGVLLLQMTENSVVTKLTTSISGTAAASAVQNKGVVIDTAYSRDIEVLVKTSHLRKAASATGKIIVTGGYVKKHANV